MLRHKKTGESIRARAQDLVRSSVDEVRFLVECFEDRFDVDLSHTQAAQFGNRLRTHASDLGRSAAEEAKFIRSWLTQPAKTGAIATSSRSLGRAMAAQVDFSQPGLIVELGPGTGVVTQSLIEAGCDEDRLVAIEYSPLFYKDLRQKFPQALILQGDAYDFDGQRRHFDDAPIAAVVSSLPLLTVKPEKRVALLNQALASMPKTGVFVQFSYGFESPVPCAGKPIDVAESNWILRNLPPARVWTYRLRHDTP